MKTIRPTLVVRSMLMVMLRDNHSKSTRSTLLLSMGTALLVLTKTMILFTHHQEDSVFFSVEFMLLDVIYQLGG